MPQVLNMRHLPKDYSGHYPMQPADAVYVGRPGPWGNPFILGINGTREECIAQFKAWIMAPQQAGLRARARQELKGKDLICWCAPADCHAYIWKEIANG